MQPRVKGSAFVMVKINKDLSGGSISILELFYVEVTNCFYAV